MQIITIGSEPTVPQPRPVLATVGMFDGMHLGHRHLLREMAALAASKQCGTAVVTFTAHPMETVDASRAPRLLTSTAQRLRLLEEAGVDTCLLLDFNASLRALDAVEFLRLVGGKLNLGGMVAGFNNRIGREGSAGMEQACRELGLFYSRASGFGEGERKVSSSAIRASLAEGDVEAAGRMLGRPYLLAGSVGHGRAIGRTLGYPTANIIPVVANKLVPAKGVYACRAMVAGFPPVWYPAMVNIGTNPTIASGSPVTIEAHLIGMEAGTSIYGAMVELHFMSRLRDERRFDSPGELKEQLNADMARTLDILSSSTIIPTI